MSSRLLVTCPSCQTRLQVRCPATATAQTRCTCGHTFTFAVPKQAAATPSVPASDDLFSSLPDATPSGSAGQFPVDLGQSRARPQRGRGAKNASSQWHTATQTRKKPKSSRPWVPLAIGGSGLLVLGLIFAGLWSFFGASLLPGPIASFFETPEAIWEDANENDLAVKRFVERYLEDPTTLEADETLLPRLAMKSKFLVARAAILEPLSEAEVNKLDIKFGADGVTGPLDDEARQSLLQKLHEARETKPALPASTIAGLFAQNKFAREFIRHGHLQTLDSDVELERIIAEQIELLRDANRMIAKITIAEFSELPDVSDDVSDEDAKAKVKTKEELKEYLDDIYEPIFADIERITRRLRQLAVKRFELGRKPAGDERQFREVFYYVNQARAEVLPHRLVLLQSGAELVSHVGKLKKASDEIDAVALGYKPSTIVEAENAEQEVEQQRQRQQSEREERIAAAEAQRKLQAEINASKSGSLATNKPDVVPLDAPMTNKNRSADERQGNRPNGNAPDGDSMVDLERLNDPFRSRFGDRRSAGPMSGRIIEPRSRNRPQPTGPTGPKFVEGEGVVIKMSGAGGISAPKYIEKFSRELSCSVSWSNNGGQLTVQLNYAGPIEDVVKLIEFGKVKSIDKESRIINLER